MNECWPLPLRPRSDELLSSWLTRLAYAHGLKVQTFCHLTWPGLPIWNRDIDKLAPTSIIELLTIQTQTPAAHAWETTLGKYEGRLYLSHNPFGNTAWILPLGIFHRYHLRNGLLFCPGCLQKDGQMPYYRTRWRLAFSVVCPQCGCFLQEQCPGCGQPVIFFRGELGHRNNLPGRSLSCCYSCGFDLAHAAVSPAPAKLLRQQRMLYRIAQEGWKKDVIYPHLYFSVLRQLVRLLISRFPKLQSLQEDLTRRYPSSTTTPYSSNVFEYLSLAQRTDVLRRALWLLEDWPKRFLVVTQYHRCSSSWLLHDFRDPPFWFESAVSSHLTVTNINRTFFFWPSPIETGVNSIVAPIHGKRGGPRHFSKTHHCLKCSSQWVIKDGYRNRKQRYRCRDCGYRFNEGQVALRITPLTKEKIEEIVELHQKGYSLRDIAFRLGIQMKRVRRWIVLKTQAGRN